MNSKVTKKVSIFATAALLAATHSPMQGMDKLKWVVEKLEKECDVTIKEILAFPQKFVDDLARSITSPFAYPLWVGATLNDDQRFTSDMLNCLPSATTSKDAISFFAPCNDFTLLHFAAQFGREKMARQLLEKGAQTDVRDQRNRTPIFYTIVDQKNSQYHSNRFATCPSSNHLATLLLLINAGAKLDHEDNREWTTLVYAAWSKQLLNVQCLIEHGADATQKEYCQHALDVAKYNKSGDDIIQYLTDSKNYVEKGDITEITEKNTHRSANFPILSILYRPHDLRRVGSAHSKPFPKYISYSNFTSIGCDEKSGQPINTSIIVANKQACEAFSKLRVYYNTLPQEKTHDIYFNFQKQ